MKISAVNVTVLYGVIEREPTAPRDVAATADSAPKDGPEASPAPSPGQAAPQAAPAGQGPAGEAAKAEGQAAPVAKSQPAAEPSASRVMNFFVTVTLQDFHGKVRSMYVSCSVWGSKEIERIYPIVQRAYTNKEQVAIVGTVTASTLQLRRPPYKTIGTLAVHVADVVAPAPSTVTEVAAAFVEQSKPEPAPPAAAGEHGKPAPTAKAAKPPKSKRPAKKQKHFRRKRAGSVRTAKPAASPKTGKAVKKPVQAKKPVKQPAKSK